MRLPVLNESYFDNLKKCSLVSFFCNQTTPSLASYKQQGRVEDWIRVEDGLPEEGGRYWCFVEELTDLGISHFQWNCSYHEVEKRFSDKYLTNGQKVTHWTKLLPSPTI
jgi:hypothetical protein